MCKKLPREDEVAVDCALGRIFRLASRPSQPGDIEEYGRCRGIVLDLLGDDRPDYRPDWIRDRRKGSGE